MRSSFVSYSIAVTKVLAIAGVLSIAAPVPAAAQGFFEQLFGLSPKQKPMQSLTVPPGQSGASGLRTPGGSLFPSRDDNSPYRVRVNGESSGGEGGTYRTLCVRTCDGYYFPISNSTTKGNFFRDQAKCKSTCGGESRLFTTPTSMSVKPKESVEAMVDLNGMAYTRLPAAFKYRKALVAGCQCKPEPWSDAELDRHRRYAEAETRSKSGQTLGQTIASTANAEKKTAAAAAVGPKTITVAAAVETVEPAVAPFENARSEEPPVKLVREKPTKTTTRVARVVEPLAEQPKPERKSATRPSTQRRPVEVAWVPPAQTPKSNGFFGGGMGLGASSSKFSWPGDAPRR